MAQRQLHASHAQRQAAYVQRKAAAQREQLAAKGLPPLPAINTIPGEVRWKALVDQAAWGLQTAASEMEDYFDGRSDSWKEGERGEAFQERLDELIAILESVTQFQENFKKA
jgi:hypothetical protein